MMTDNGAVYPDRRRSFSRWLARLVAFFAIAMVALSWTATLAENPTLAGDHADSEQGIGQGEGLKPYRQRALTALLTNERRSIDRRIEQVMGELQRLGADEPSDDARPASTRLREELAALEQRRAEVAVELSELEGGPDTATAGTAPSDAAPSDTAPSEGATDLAGASEGDVPRTVFIPAGKPRGSDQLDLDAAEVDTLERRRRIQEALVFFGGYDSRIDGDFGARTETAIRRYQADIGAEPTGRLTESQVERLLEAAANHRRESGLTPLADDVIGFRLIYPSAYLTRDEPGDGGYRLLSDDSGRARLQVVNIESRDLLTVFDDLTRHAEDGYRHFAKTWFVASGETDGTMFYSMGRSAGDGAIVAHLTYPVAERARWDPITVILYNSFELTSGST